MKSYFWGVLLIVRYIDFFTEGTKYIDDVQTEMTPHEDEDFVIIDIDVKKFFANKTGNIMLSAEEDGNLYNAETFAHLEAIRLLLRLSYIMKFKLYQMDVKNALPNRYLNMKVN